MGLFLDYENARQKRLKYKELYDAVVLDLESARAVQADNPFVEDLKAVKLGHLADAKAAEKERVEAAEGFFSLLYANLLSVEARVAWPDWHSPLDGLKGT